MDRVSAQNPVRKIIENLGPRSTLNAFTYNLRDDERWNQFKTTSGIKSSDLKPAIERSLGRYIIAWKRVAISVEAQIAHLTRLIPMESRKVPGLLLADVSLAAPMPSQDSLFRYRCGMFMFNVSCPCYPEAKFVRGHEKCFALQHPIRLTKAERTKKTIMQSELGLAGVKLTDIDYLLNIARLDDAGLILSTIREQLRQSYHDTKKAEQIR